MTIFNANNLNASVLIGTIQSQLKLHRQVLEALNDSFTWAAGITAADLEAAPFNMSAADANAFLSAIADAHAEYAIHTTGLPPSTYPQPASAYVYAASQNQIIGLS